MVAYVTYMLHICTIKYIYSCSGAAVSGLYMFIIYVYAMHIMSTLPLVSSPLVFGCVESVTPSLARRHDMVFFAGRAEGLRREDRCLLVLVI